MRKIVCIILCILLIGTVAITASATETCTLTADKTAINTGDEVTISVNISADAPVKSVGFKFDSAVFGNYEYVSSTINVPGAFIAVWKGDSFAITYMQPTSYSGTLTVTFRALKPNSIAISGKVSVDYGDGEGSHETEITGPVVKASCSHSWSEWETKDRTCTEDGYKKRTCTLCGEIDEQKLEAQGHDLTTVTVPSTCTVAGYETTTCSRCDYEETVPLGLAKHEYEWVLDYESTCAVPGQDIEKCKNCDATRDTRPRDLLSHTLTYVAIDDEKHTVKCEKCTYSTEEVHNFGGWETVKAPSCVEGLEKRVCKDCGKEVTRTIRPAGEHVYSNWVDNEDGTHTGTCIGCSTRSDPVAHTENDGIVTQDPTCITDGVKIYSCSFCGAFMRDEPIPASDDYHNYGAWTYKDAELHERICSLCNDAETGKHEWNKGIVTKQPTCSEDGERAQVCSVCNGTRVVVESATGDHDYTDHYVEIDNKTHKAFCACGQFITEEHAYTTEGDILTKPTTTKEGQQEMLCACSAKTTVTLKKVPADYDDVPKTGDITGQIVLFTVSAVAVIAGAAYIVIKRKLVK